MIYILGANGYIGSHLLEQINPMPDVIGVDRNIKYIKHLESKNCEIVQMDLFNETPDFKNGDIIYHLATMKHYPAQFDENQAKRDIYDITSNILDKCIGKEVLLIFTSSRTVYGKTMGEISEDAPLNPTTVYGKLKKKCEELVAQKAHRYAIIRLSSVYGGFRPFDVHMGVADKFMFSALHTYPLYVEGGFQMFDFTFIDEVIEGLVKAGSSDKSNYRIHFTSGVPTSIISLACMIKNVCCSNSKIEIVPPRDYEKEPTVFWGNPDKCNEILHQRFDYDLKKGLTEMLKRYEKNLGE